MGNANWYTESTKQDEQVTFEIVSRKLRVRFTKILTYHCTIYQLEMLTFQAVSNEQNISV